MAPTYEVTVDEALSALFLHRLARTLRADGFEELVYSRNPTGLRIHQFRRGPRLLVVTRSPESGGKEKIVITSETLILESHVAAAITATATELLGNLLSPLAPPFKIQVEQALSQQLRGLVDSQIRGVWL